MSNAQTRYLTIIQQIFTIGSAVVGIILAIVTYRLWPILSAVQTIDLRVNAIESNYSRKDTVDTGFKHIGEKLDKMEAKIDRLIEK